MDLSKKQHIVPNAYTYECSKYMRTHGRTHICMQSHIFSFRYTYATYIGSACPPTSVCSILSFIFGIHGSPQGPAPCAWRVVGWLPPYVAGLYEKNLHPFCEFKGGGFCMDFFWISEAPEVGGHRSSQAPLVLERPYMAYIDQRLESCENQTVGVYINITTILVYKFAINIIIGIHW